MVIDPGFGFGKTLEQNFQLLRELDAFAMLELPIMVGISRKSMIYKSLEYDPSRGSYGYNSRSYGCIAWRGKHPEGS